MALDISPQNAMALAQVLQGIAVQYPKVKQAANQFCALLSMQTPALPAVGGGGSGNPYDQPAQNGSTNMGGSNGNGGCACNLPSKPSTGGYVPPALPGQPAQQCGLPALPQGGGMEQVGTWNCQQVDLDLAPCQVSKIMREETLPTVIDELPGLIASGTEIAVEFAPIGVSHSLCIEFVRVTISDDADPPNVVTVAIPRIELQGEVIAQLPEGPYDHVWEWGSPERPAYLGITDGRCACAKLCVCVSAEGHARLVFTLPQEVPLNSTLRVEVWGRREAWGRVCGPCPPCLRCDQVPLTDAEEAAVEDTVYVVDGT